MGILDDAIREHLELKRQHGASRSDLERLENEAFGPPGRPGDAEFEDEEAAVELGEEVEAPPAEEERPAASWLADSDEFEIAPRAAEADDGAGHGEGAGEELPPESEATPAERARIEHDHLQDTVDHPALDHPEIEEGEPPPPLAPEPEDRGEQPPEAPEGAIFDVGDDFDLDEPDSDSGDLPPLPDDAATEHELPSFDAEEESEAPPPESADPGEREEAFGADEELEDELEDEDEDLLEETPDFLADAPEGERLWFEQGEPKDFDFDD